VRVRRSAYLLFRFSGSELLDVGELLRGRIAASRRPPLVAVSALTAREEPVSLDEIELASRVPVERWISTADLGDVELVERLAWKAVLLTDLDEGPLAELRRREERLAAQHWEPGAAVFHFANDWRDVDTGMPEHPSSTPADVREGLEQLVAAYGLPPVHFHTVSEPLAIRDLPLVAGSGGLHEALRARRTTRSFDASRELPLEELALVLHRTFGCHGYRPAVPGLVTLRKSSPSGGGLHPIEAYPLVVAVESLEPGLYHYNVEAHSLHLVDRLAREDARAVAVRLTAGQTYFGDAHALVVLAARFGRSFWKYRGDGRAYAVLLLDAGHLSQTFHLVCAELGLGAFVTAAVNPAPIEEALGLDGYEQGVLAVCGCGLPAAEDAWSGPEPIPYVPRETLL
jgi:putative peptide maturation dehydrogenase